MGVFEFENSPFPYSGEIPGRRKPFLDVSSNGRRGHSSARGGVYWEDVTYSDRRTLLYIPPGFDPSEPAFIIAFFHGNSATLDRDVNRRQRVPAQLLDSGANAVLVAPQFAVDALDSSAGHFWDVDGFDRFLDESAAKLASLYGQDVPKAAFDDLPVVIVAYSGGYLPASYSLQSKSVRDRLIGLVLFDAVYGEIDRFADWIEAERSRAFFLSAYSPSSQSGNLELRHALDKRGVAYAEELPASLQKGEISFAAVGSNVVHDDFVTMAWSKDPLRDVLAIISIPQLPEGVAASGSSEPAIVQAQREDQIAPSSEMPAPIPEKAPEILAETESRPAAQAEPPRPSARASSPKERRSLLAVVGASLMGIGACGLLVALFVIYYRRTLKPLGPAHARRRVRT